MKLFELKDLFRYGLLGYGVCRAIILEYLRYSKDDASFSAENVIVFRAALLVGAFAFLLVWKHISNANKLESASRAVLIVGVMGVSLIAVGHVSQITAYAYLGFAMTGLCMGFYEVNWCLYFVGLDSRTLFANVLIAILFSAAIGIVLSLLSPLGLSYLISLALLISMAAFDSVAKKKTPVLPSVFEKGGSCASGEEPAAVRSTAERGSLSRLAAITLASLLFSVVHSSGLSLVSAGLASDFSYLVRTAANLITIVMLAAYFLFCGIGRSGNILRSVLFFTTAGLLLGMLTSDGGRVIALFVFCCGNKLFDILLWVLAVETLVGVPSCAAKGFAGIVAAKNAGVIIGTAMLQFFVGTDSERYMNEGELVSLLVLMLIVTLLWVLSEKVLYGRAAGSSSQKDGLAVVRIASMEEAALSVGTEFQLTPREMDVFLLMARGKNRTTIATELCISRNTAHTHMVHIYQKTGTSGQQEIIELVESQQKRE